MEHDKILIELNVCTRYNIFLYVVFIKKKQNIILEELYDFWF